MGYSESLIGRALKGWRDKAFLSVKFGAMFSPSGAFLSIEGRPASVKNFATYSLQRLGVEVIDLYADVCPEIFWHKACGLSKNKAMRRGLT